MDVVTVVAVVMIVVGVVIVVAVMVTKAVVCGLRIAHQLEKEERVTIIHDPELADGEVGAVGLSNFLATVKDESMKSSLGLSGVVDGRGDFHPSDESMKSGFADANVTDGAGDFAPSDVGKPTDGWAREAGENDLGLPCVDDDEPEGDAWDARSSY